MADHKLIGHNYTTPDIVAKVTGQAKYAEDYRAEGMLFAKLLLSPMPHARVRRVDASAALAMPGVKAVITADDLPLPGDSISDLGVTIKASPWGERALTNEPVYQGDPILAVAAVDETTAAAAIEQIEIDFEPLPFCVDPIETLRPSGPNPRTTGNVWMRPPARPGMPEGALEVREWKWSADDFAAAPEGQLPLGKTPDEWSYGDVEAGFTSAALVIDDSFVTPNTSHQTLEPRSILAYWQNGKLHLHSSNQGLVQTVFSMARWLRMKPEEIVVINPYTGGGFGSKSSGTITAVVAATLAKKTGVPVMLRISREEEHSIGGARPAFQGRVKVGFAKDGRITAVDMLVVCDNGAYDPIGDTGMSGRIVSLLFQPPAMRWRGVTVLTNTPPRRAQSQPGGLQGIMLIEPLIDRAARQLGIDQVAIRRMNMPEGKATFGPVMRTGQRAHVTSAFIKEALDRGAGMFNWEERKARSGQRRGAKARGAGVGVSTFVGGGVGYDGLFVITPDGHLQIKSGIGALGTSSVHDVHRVVAELLDVPWEKCHLVWGDSTRNLPWSCVSGGSTTTHTMSRAAHAAAMDAKRKLQEIAAHDLGGKPEDYDVANERVFRRGGGAGLTLAQAAKRAIELGGRYDGHELPDNINAYTKTSATAMAGQGLIGVAKDTYPRDGQTFSFVAGFAEVEVDLETGKFALLDYLAVGDVGTVLHPRNLGGQLLGRSMLGIGHAIGQKWVYDQHYGAALAKRFYQNRPPTILDAPAAMQWAALDIPDPETPVGARGIGEPPVGAGCMAVLNAIAAAVGDDVFRRAPISLDMIVTALEVGHPTHPPLTANV